MKEKKLRFTKSTLDNFNPYLAKHEKQRARGGSDTVTSCPTPGGVTDTPVYC